MSQMKKYLELVEKVMNDELHEDSEMYQPPKAAQKNAQKALDWRDEHGDEVKGGTRVGWTRANQLAKGEKVS